MLIDRLLYCLDISCSTKIRKSVLFLNNFYDVLKRCYLLMQSIFIMAMFLSLRCCCFYASFPAV